MALNKLLLKIAGMTVIAANMLILSACTAPAKIYVNENPAADFANYKTYNYETVLGTDNRKGYRSILSNYLVDATNREMQSRGYRLDDNPDLIVNFFVATAEKIRSSTSPSMGGGYYGYRGGYYGAYGGYETQVTQYTEGTLNVDIVDNRKDELAWEGIAVGKITDKVKENLKLAASNAMGEVFARYPHTAAGYVAVQSANGGK